jgi:trimethylamine--corrinoid protein Co-methyltransferase
MSMLPPESSLVLAAQAQIARFIGLPTWGLAGGTDSKLIDAQAGAESAFSILAQAMAGINLIHDVGYMDMGMCCSCDMLVLGDELIGWTKRFMRGLPINAEEIALDAVRAVGPGGNYLMQKQTLERCRSEYWMPELFSRDPRSVWEKKGRIDIRERVHDKVLRLLDEHLPPELPAGTLQALEEIKSRVEKEQALS